MDVYKCKIDENGLVDKLKVHYVYRGDLHKSFFVDLDTWNPHADWPTLLVFLAMAAKGKMILGQLDMIQAYLQIDMTDELFIRFPEHWKDALPEEFARFCGIPLRSLKAIYGYERSGLLLFEAQAKFFTKYGLKACEGAKALWVKRFDNENLLIVLQYSDDVIHGATEGNIGEDFKKAFCERFSTTPKPLNWFLQSRIRQDADFNITIDQQQFAMSVIRRYLPNSPLKPTPEDVQRYASPLPTTFKFSKSDNSKDTQEVALLEEEFGFRFLEVIGSLNWLSHTCFEELFAIRKGCKFMHRPGRRHFKAIRHLLNHIRCHTPKALKFYSDVSRSPLFHLIKDAGLKIDTTLVTFTDSSWGDCDDQHSTGCYCILLQGGVVDASSFVPNIVTGSSAEAETNASCVATMATIHIRQIVMEILSGSPDTPLTVPVLTDSTASDTITRNDKDTRRTRHIERRWLYTRHARHRGDISIHHINGDKYQVADLGTKNVPASESTYKLSIIEADPIP